MGGGVTEPSRPRNPHPYELSALKLCQQRIAHFGGADGLHADEADVHGGGFLNTPVSTVPKQPSTLSTVLSAQNLSNLFNAGLGVLSTTLTNKSNKELAQKALEIEQEKTKQAALLAASGGLRGAASPGLSTGAKIGIGLAVAATVGTIIYLLVRRKKFKGGGKTAVRVDPPPANAVQYKKRVPGMK